MDQRDKARLTERLYNVLSSLKNQNSGADIHTVGNMRNTATMLIEELAGDTSLEFDCARRMVENVEGQLIVYYKDKYPAH